MHFKPYGQRNVLVLTRVNIHRDVLTSHIFIVLSLEPDIKYGPLRPPFFNCKYNENQKIKHPKTMLYL